MRRTTPLTKEELAVKRSRTGLGLFATTTLLPGRYIEYIGRRITAAEADALAHTRYLFEVTKNVTIDGRPKENLARYINHSCNPNCESLVAKNRVYIKVIRAIAAGEELGYDYGEEYFNEYIAPYGCRCAYCTHDSIR